MRRVAVRALADDVPSRALTAVFDDQRALVRSSSRRTRRGRGWRNGGRDRVFSVGVRAIDVRRERDRGRKRRGERGFYPRQRSCARGTGSRARTARLANRRWRRNRSWKRNSSPPLARISSTRLRLSAGGPGGEARDLRDEKRQRRRRRAARSRANERGSARRAPGRRCALRRAAPRGDRRRIARRSIASRARSSGRSRVPASGRDEARCRTP